ncbi:hypothetical protein MNBD_GAMMA21-1879 [hydrothermal vent metagenome]|uniref:DUF350 domain-containing protein n=1 Tax=hydrothermal vent metagenome TaxID=652676 RepID=A0A3B1AAU1_9ZZZZ
MEITTLSQTLINLLISLSYAIITLIVSVTTLYMIDHFFYKKIDFIEEIKNGNIAASIFYSVILLFVAIIVTISIN